MTSESTYAIVTDGKDSWWVQGNEGRVNEELFTTLEDAADYFEGLTGERDDVYYVDTDDGQGADWSKPIKFVFA